jgi:hypothetical protein
MCYQAPNCKTASLNQTKQHWYTSSTRGSTGNTGMAMVIVFPRDAPCYPWLALSQSLWFRFSASSLSTGKRPLLQLFWRFSTEEHRTARLLRDMVRILPSLFGLPGKPILTGRFIAHRISSLTAPTLYRGLEQVDGRVCLKFFIAARTRSPRRAFSARSSFSPAPPGRSPKSSARLTTHGLSSRDRSPCRSRISTTRATTG